MPEVPEFLDTRRRKISWGPGGEDFVVAKTAMKTKGKVNVFKFAWGSLPVDALDRQTMAELQVIAAERGITVEEVISEALQWVLADPEAELEKN